MEKRSQQAIGSAISDIGNRMVQADIATTRIKNDIYLKEASTRMERYFNERAMKTVQQMNDDELLGKDGRDQFYMNNLQKDYDDFIKEQIRLAPNERAAEVFGLGAEASFNDIKKRDQLEYFKAINTRANRNTEEKAKDLNMRVYRNPGEKSLEAAKAELAVATEIYDLTLDPDQARMAKMKLNADMSEAMFDGWLDKKQFLKARKELNSKKYDDELGADRVSRIKKKIDAGLRTRATKKKDLRSMMLRDPHKYWEQIGMPLSPIDMGNPESWENRVVEIEERAKKTKIPKNFVTIMSPLEEEWLLKEVSTRDPKELIGYFNQFRSVPEQTFYRVAGQVAKKDPIAAYSMDLVRSGTPKDQINARNLIIGSRLLKKSEYDKSSGVRLPKRSDMEFYADSLLGGISMGPDDRHIIKSSLIAGYAKKRVDDGVNTTEFDVAEQKRMKSVLHEMGGYVFEWGGKKFLTPQRPNGDYLTGDDAELALERINNRALKASHGSEIYDGAGVFDIDNVNRGAFYIEKDLDDPDFFNIILKKKNSLDKALLDKNGKRFKLDLSKLYASTHINKIRERTWTEKATDLIKSIMPEGIEDEPQLKPGPKY